MPARICFLKKTRNTKRFTSRARCEIFFIVLYREQVAGNCICIVFNWIAHDRTRLLNIVSFRFMIIRFDFIICELLRSISVKIVILLFNYLFFLIKDRNAIFVDEM